MPSLIRATALLRGDIMQITIGSTSDDRRKLNKSFSGTQVTVQLKSPCDILAPVFILSYNALYLTANYVYAPELGRYYFIDNVSIAPGAKIEISCSVDVLMSYASQIAAITTTVSRQEYANLTTIPDSNVVIKNYDIINIYASSVGFDTGFGNYVLELYGG